MGSAKDEVRRILEQIPDNASFEDIQYHIYVREKIDRGLEDVEQGRVISQEEAERRMRKGTGEQSGLKPPGVISSRSSPTSGRTPPITLPHSRVKREMLHAPSRNSQIQDLG